MVRKSSVIQLGHPGLRQQAQPVVDPQAPEIRQLVRRLKQTLRQDSGVGIAAPQLNCPWQLVIVASYPNRRYPQAPKMEPTVLINPRLVSHSEEQVLGWEGCLSVPCLRGQVLRYREVQVEYLDCQGRQVQRLWDGFAARIFQHEYDHLQGKVFLDRVESSLNLISEQEYQARVVSP